MLELIYAVIIMFLCVKLEDERKKNKVLKSQQKKRKSRKKVKIPDTRRKSRQG